ncbi:glycoside hydrolase family 16 protein [Acidocella sp.]|uniref:glycoside hydrolase family 16 protein n=1 Tax=Acidocella sp. TaxID=50710 RepID=UPI00260B8642|nr:glycoside hydrolase family 16 protein [Acidocella sp.]
MALRLLHAALGAMVLATGLARGAPLDMSQYHLSFQDDFTHPDITAHGGPGGRWIAHTPWNGDFGNDVFDDPGSGSAFSYSPQGLTITARKDATGKWHAGLICSVDKDGSGARGFAQQYGYFEMTAKLPPGAGVWPAFWLEGVHKKKGTSEIDIMEYYGHAPNKYHITEHYWVNGHDTLGAWHVVTVPGNVLATQYNKFGVSITRKYMTFYFNRIEVWRTPTPPEYNQPMYLLADLAIGGGWPYNKLVSPVAMTIHSISAYNTLH